MEKSLYEVLDNCTYILANGVEEAYEYSSGNYNYRKESAYEEAGYPEIYQTYIIDGYTRDILKNYGEIVWYNEDLDLYFWGVTHYGTHWSHIMGSQYPIQNEDKYIS